MTREELEQLVLERNLAVAAVQHEIDQGRLQPQDVALAYLGENPGQEEADVEAAVLSQLKPAPVPPGMG